MGRYLLLERLATGGMAEVYRAKASGAGGFEKQLAVKRILPNYSANDEFQRMFEYEARLSSMLSHANIVQVYDFVKSDDTFVLAMEYVDGKNLRQFVNKAKKLNTIVPMEFAIYVINEVCKGLEYAHTKRDLVNGKPLNIVHRDMSPQNIMLSYEGAVKIVDFGIAKAKDKVDETRSGVIKGKFGYMSPEQANGESVDHRTDIFSTGIILFEMLTHKRLFVADNDMATLKMIQECAIPLPSRVNPKIPPELEKIILKALTKDLTLRYQSAGQFHRNLQEYMNKFYPSYTQREVNDLLQGVFREEIFAEKKRMEEAYRQSIPYSQGTSEKGSRSKESSEAEEKLDGDLTRSEEVANKSDVTIVEDLESLSVSKELQDMSLSSNTSAHISKGGDDEEKEKEEPRVINLDEVSEMVDLSGSLPKPANTPEASSQSKDSLKKLFDSNSGGVSKPDNIDSRTGKSSPQYPSVPAIFEVDATKGNPTKGNTSSSINAPSFTKKTNATEAKPTEQNWKNVKLSTKTDGPDNIARRRERSISATRDVRAETNSQIKLENTANEPPRPPNRDMPLFGKPASLPEPMAMPQDELLVAPRRRSRRLFSTILLIGGIGSVSYLYQLYFSGRIPTVIQEVSPRDVATPIDSPGLAITKNQTSAFTAPINPIKPSVGDCNLEVTTDPLGAKVTVDGVARGNSAIAVPGACGAAVKLVIAMDNYETVAQEVNLKDKVTKVYKTLKRVPMGTLELRLSTNAKIFIDGELAGDISANQVFEKSLTASKTHKVRFVNEIFRMDFTREFKVEENTINRQTVDLESIPSSVSTRPK